MTIIRALVVPMMPVVAGALKTKWQMLFYAVALMVVVLSLPLLHMAGMGYAVSAALLSVAFLYHIGKLFRDQTDKWARKTFAFSIYYLFMLFTVMMVDGLPIHHHL